MAPPTPQQLARRARIESVIGLAAPFLDLMLAAGERISRITGPPDDYIPIRPPSEAFELDRGGASPQRTKPELSD